MSGTTIGSRTPQDDLAREFLHNYSRGARLLAVAATDPARSADFADMLAAALRTQGVVTGVVAQGGRGESELRSEVVAPMRDAGVDAVTIVCGDTSLLAERTRWMWHSSIWLAAGGEMANTDADAIVDITDPQHPTRRFADFCQCDVG
ncbi:hypothetical protein ACIPV2_12070 [Microbacterium sp. NPDC089987]|uniref:hypothetical protein n=1 Tax=Microbacterium sp. NPDC089987 TaxID=3364202 RepID=UPI0038252084